MILKLPQDLSVTPDVIKKIPEKPGVYSFLDGQKKPLYIGKAINLKNRVSSHLKNKKERLFGISKFLRIEISDSEIAALIKESELIKKFQPKLNIAFRDDKQYFYLCFSQDSIQRILIRHQPKNFFLGPYTDGKALKNSLALIRKTLPFCTCKVPHLRKCLNSQIGLCFGFCCEKKRLITKEEKTKYRENIEKIKKIFSGNDRSLKKEIEKEIKASAKNENFEKAQILKLQLLGLEKIFSHQKFVSETTSSDKTSASFIGKLKNLAGLSQVNRIEFYDSSQLQGSNRVAAMTVFENGNYQKNEWRLFKIKNEKAKDDLAILKEVLERRFDHQEWQGPDILVVDGGKNQLKTAANLIKDHEIKILALQKNAKHQPEHLLILRPDRKSARIIHLSKLPVSLRNFLEDFSEKTHSFAIRFHRKKRDKI